jgi:subtilisin family serine protease
MKSIHKAVVAFLLVLCCAQSGVAVPAGAVRDRARWVADEIIVKFQGGLSQQRIDTINRRQGGSILSTSPFAGFKKIKLPAGKAAEQMIERYRQEPDVEYAELNYYAYATFVPDDTYYSFQWHFNDPAGSINVEPAWDITTGDPNVIVAVVDTGVAYEDYLAPEHWNISPYKAYNGNSWWCGVNDGNWPASPGYGNGWKDYLQHGFDLTTATGTVSFSYKYCHDLEVTHGVAYDKVYTEISTDNGRDWAILKTYTGTTTGKTGWKGEELNLTSYAGSEVLIRFRIASDEAYSDEDGFFDSDGAFFVDNIRLTDDVGQLFYDDVESGPGSWQKTTYELAPDFENTRFVAGYDFINNDGHANDDNRHGTHVAGTIAQSTNNARGVAGIAFNATIMPVKVLDSMGSGDYQQVADGIYYAVDNGANIINMSLGGPDPAQVLEDAVAYAYNNGVAVVASCGNSATASCGYPAAYDSYVIAVGATQYNATKAPYSSYGPSVDVVAPGGNTSADQNGDGYADGVLQVTFSDTVVDWAYWFFQGTSMASPHVAGISALLASKSVTDPDDIREALQNTTRDLGAVGRDNTFGWGLVDAFAALNYFAIPGDFTGDGGIDWKDARVLGIYWLDDEPAIDIAPAGGDGIINFLDLAKLAQGL